MAQPFDVLVIGNGLFGSAAARHLSVLGRAVAVIGPDEPVDTSNHHGVFASHYDEGRLTRMFDRRPEWASVTRRAIDGYRALEDEAGIDFYHPVGALIAGPASDLDAVRPDNPTFALAERGIDHSFYAPGDRSWRTAWPQLDFPEEFYVVHEPAPAGHINPRRMIEAQNRVAQMRDATVIRARVTSVQRRSGGFCVTTEGGTTLNGTKVVVAAGAFTNFGGLLPEPAPFTIETEIIALGRVSAASARALTPTPTVKYLIDDPVIDDVYMVPPVRFPDGNHYIKLGANTDADLFPETLDEIGQWFRDGDSDFALPSFEAALASLWPGTEFTDFVTGRCILCRTPSGNPMISEVDDGWFVLSGGNGGGAKGADAWGELAAGLVHDGRWPADQARLNG